MSLLKGSSFRINGKGARLVEDLALPEDTWQGALQVEVDEHGLHVIEGCLFWALYQMRWRVLRNGVEILGGETKFEDERERFAVTFRTVQLPSNASRYVLEVRRYRPLPFTASWSVAAITATIAGDETAVTVPITPDLWASSGGVPPHTLTDVTVFGTATDDYTLTTDDSSLTVTKLTEDSVEIAPQTVRLTITDASGATTLTTTIPLNVVLNPTE